MWADVEPEVDYLNFTELALLVAELLKEERLLPISIGVFGWLPVRNLGHLQAMARARRTGAQRRSGNAGGVLKDRPLWRGANFRRDRNHRR